MRAGWPHIGAQLLAAADRMITQLEPFLFPSDKLEYARLADEARQTLGEAIFEVAWQRGRALLANEIVTIVRALTPDVVPAPLLVQSIE